MNKLFKKALSITLSLTLLFSAVFALPLGASAEEKTYQYFSLGYDKETDVTGIKTSGLPDPTGSNTVTWESGENRISGTGSLKYTFSNTMDPLWAFMAPKTALQVTKDHSYRISLKLKASFSPNGTGSMGVDIGFATNHYQVNTQDYTAKVNAINGRTDVVQNVSKTVTAVYDGYLAFQGYTHGAVGDSFLLDDVVVAEIIDSVTATSANEAMGTATVANKDGKNSDFAVKETAVFTATPKDGYKFVCWKDASGNVVEGAGATYEMQVTTDTALTAYFERDAIFIQDFEAGHFDVASGNTLMAINTDEAGLNGQASGARSLVTIANAEKVEEKYTRCQNPLMIPLYSGSNNVTLKPSKTYRVSFDVKLKETKSGWVAFQLFFGQKDNGWAKYKDIAQPGGDVHSIINFNTTDWQSIACTITAPETMTGSNDTLGFFYNSVPEFYLDNIVVREVLPENSVKATSADETMGTATVTNTATNKIGGTAFTDFAYKETARFTAEPKEGYEFVCWKKGDEIVSRKANYDMEITDSVTLTAYFQKEPFRGDLYQNFENYFSGDLGNRVVGSVQIGTHDSEDAENTVAYYNGSTAGSQGVAQNRFILNPKGAFSNPEYTNGSQFTMRFKYKVTTEETVVLNIYGSTNSDNAWVHTDGALGYPNITLTQASGWQTKDVTITVNDATKISYILVFVGGAGTVCLDDIMIFKTENIPVNYTNEAVRLVTENDSDPFNAARVGNEVTFRAQCDSTVTPTVTYGGVPVNPVDGLYTITVVRGSSISVTTTGQTAAQNHAPGVGLNREDLTKYDPDVYMNKIWEGTTVYHEPVMFAQSSDGINLTTKKLLYPVEDIVSIRSANLKTYYIKGVDYKIEDGKIVWLPGGQMPIYTGPLTVPKNANASDYPSEVTQNGTVAWGETFPVDENNGLYGIWDGYHERHTVYVTYTHNTTWSEGEGYNPAVPENQSADMTAFYNKLAANDNSGINVLVYGDSTATGASATGQNVNYDLFDANGNVTRSQGGGIKAPVFFEQATAQLAKGYVNSGSINYYNIALGGKNTAWGAENLQARVNMMNNHYGKTITPDIIYVKFCANDMGLTADEYKTNMQSIVDQFQELYHNASIVLVSGKINNVRSTNFGTPEALAKVDAFENALADIASNETNCIVAKNTSVWKEIVKSKNCEDYLSNFVNHANDFWSMVTAQVIVASAQKANTTTSQVETAYNNAAALRTASNSNTRKNGLRIYNQIPIDWIGSANIVEYGSIAIRTNRLNSAELVYNNEKAVKGVAYSDGTYSTVQAAKLWDSADGSYVFTSYLTGIPEIRYGENYTVRAYAIGKDGKIYYGEEIKISVFAIANAIDRDDTLGGTEQSDADKAAFSEFVNSTNYTGYQTWCTANGKTTGKLFAEKYGSNS